MDSTASHSEKKDASHMSKQEEEEEEELLTNGVPSGTRIQLSRMPDDFHHHLRDAPYSGSVMKPLAERYGRCLVMPNLHPPVTTTEKALAYHDRLKQQAAPHHSTVEFLMTLYLTDNTTAEEVRKAHATGRIVAAKYYPAGATTNSDYGVTDVVRTFPALEAMQEVGMVLCIHSEVTTPSVDIFEREPVFIEQIMKPLAHKFPTLKIVMEHVSTKEAVDYVQNEAPPNVAATITAHHLLYNRNAMLVGGIRPDYYCLPILKRELDRLALLEAATSGNPRFFAGTDSAPHATHRKYQACGCAGVFTGHASLELYAEAFEEAQALSQLDNFLCRFGAQHYGLPLPASPGLTLEKKSWTVPEKYDFGNQGETLTPLRAGKDVTWSIVANDS